MNHGEHPSDAASPDSIHPRHRRRQQDPNGHGRPSAPASDVQDASSDDYHLGTGGRRRGQGEGTATGEDVGARGKLTAAHKQRLYRERKQERHEADQKELAELRAKNQRLTFENEQLRREHEQLRAELDQARQAAAAALGVGWQLYRPHPLLALPMPDQLGLRTRAASAGAVPRSYSLAYAKPSQAPSLLSPPATSPDPPDVYGAGFGPGRAKADSSVEGREQHSSKRHRFASQQSVHSVSAQQPGPTSRRASVDLGSRSQRDHPYWAQRLRAPGQLAQNSPPGMDQARQYGAYLQETSPAKQEYLQYASPHHPHLSQHSDSPSSQPASQALRRAPSELSGGPGGRGHGEGTYGGSWAGDQQAGGWAENTAQGMDRQHAPQGYGASFWRPHKP